MYNIPRVSVPISLIHQYWSRFFYLSMVLRFYLVACLLLLVLSLIPGSRAIGNADGTGSNGSFIPTWNEQVSGPINIIVLLWTFYLRLKVWLNLVPKAFPLKKWVGRPNHFSREKPWGRGWVWLRYWGLGCESIQTEDSIPAVEVQIRFAFCVNSFLQH